MNELYERGLVVSMTPSMRTPWREPEHVVRLAGAAQDGGAVAVKVDGPAAARAVKEQFNDLVVIAVHLDYTMGKQVRITSRLDQAEALFEAGADIVELGADSALHRADGQDMGELVSRFCEIGGAVKANIGSAADARIAVAAGAVMVGSSMAGYPLTATTALPDLDLVSVLVAAVNVPVVAERGYTSASHVAGAIEAGAHSVVIGSAIVDPVWLTERFASQFA